MKFKSIVAAALFAFTAGGALAQFSNTYNIGTMPLTPPSPPFAQTVTVPLGSFNDRWNFTFPLTGAVASSSTISLDLPPLMSITGLQLSLFNASNNQLLATGVQSGQSATLNSFPLTGGQNYYYVVSGNATGLGGGNLSGAYTMIASASPVPEPETYALFLAGLAAIGFVARRRSPALSMSAAAA